MQRPRSCKGEGETQGQRPKHEQDNPDLHGQGETQPKPDMDLVPLQLHCQGHINVKVIQRLG